MSTLLNLNVFYSSIYSQLYADIFASEIIVKWIYLFLIRVNSHEMLFHCFIIFNSSNSCRLMELLGLPELFFSTTLLYRNRCRISWAKIITIFYIKFWIKETSTTTLFQFPQDRPNATPGTLFEFSASRDIHHHSPVHPHRFTHQYRPSLIWEGKNAHVTMSHSKDEENRIHHYHYYHHRHYHHHNPSHTPRNFYKAFLKTFSF